MIRKPAVSGTFYPADREALSRNVSQCLPVVNEKIEARAIVVPHAGYLYSGPCAGRVYASVEIPDTIVILCPNHTGTGAPIAIMSDGQWQTPLGLAPIDGELASAIMSEDRGVEDDETAHRREHALEVQLPFLQTLHPSFRFVPLCVGTQQLESLLALGGALARAITAAARRVLIVISSDMSHYIPADRARALDAMAIGAIEAVDPERLFEVVRREGITMCGIAPAVAGLAAARALGATRGRLLAYTNSGQQTGDLSEVVAYAGLVVH